jgi:hypothetical protein
MSLALASAAQTNQKEKMILFIKVITFITFTILVRYLASQTLFVTTP